MPGSVVPLAMFVKALVYMYLFPYRHERFEQMVASRLKQEIKGNGTEIVVYYTLIVLQYTIQCISS